MYSMKWSVYKLANGHILEIIVKIAKVRTEIVFYYYSVLLQFGKCHSYFSFNKWNHWDFSIFIIFYELSIKKNSAVKNWDNYICSVFTKLSTKTNYDKFAYFGKKLCSLIIHNHAIIKWWTLMAHVKFKLFAN